MHPILGHPRRLALYLFAWLTVTELLFYLITYHSGVGWLDAGIFLFPLSVFYAFVCLSAWYSCRGIPIEGTSFLGLVGPHLLAAIIVSGFWVLTALGFAKVLSHTARFSDIETKVLNITQLLLIIGILEYLLAVALFYVLQAQQESREAEQRVMEAHMLARDAELRALKAQVNPHFLFNSLHSISALTSSDPKRAREMCIALADFLRATLGLGEKELIPLQEELSLIHSFLAVEKIRFGTRLNMEEKIDAQVLNCMVPPLILQPLVENAVAHGIANLTEGGWIRLNAAYAEHNLAVAIHVENTFDPDAPARRRSGLGLANVRRRLDTRYGKSATFAVEKNGGLFHVGLVLPAERQAVTA